MDFKQDILEYIKGEFEFLDISYTPSGDIDADLLKLFTIHKKIVFPLPRVTAISKELRVKIDNHHKHREEILQLKQMLEEGSNINPHQTKNLFNFHVHDDLLYDWGIYHFHLSFEKGAGYFTKRTGEVLFVYITKERAYLLDVLKHPPHDIFANKILLEIIDNNWEDILAEANGIVGLSHNPSQQERYQLRKHNVNTGITEVNGKFMFAPGLGQTTSGHSVEEVMKLNHFNRWLAKNEKAIINHRDTLDKQFMEQQNLTAKPAYKIVFTGEGPQIWDSNTMTCLVKYNEIISSASN